MPLVRAVYHDLLRSVAERSNQGRNDGGQGARFLGHQTTMKAPKSPNNVTSTSVQYICFRKTSGSKMVVPNLLLAQAPSNLVTPLTVIQYYSALSMYMKRGVAQLHSYVGHNYLS